jgi:hypothetical protein
MRKNKLFVSLSALSLAILIAWLSFTTKSFGGMGLAFFFVLISLLSFTGPTNALVLLAFTTLSLTAAEFTTGIFNKYRAAPQTTHFSPDSDYVIQRDAYRSMSELGFLPLPGRYTSKKLSEGGDTVYDVVYSIGEDRFRITPQTNHTAQIHINFFGCSFTFGEGLNDNETLPYFTHFLADHISVKNYGMHGYGVHQALRILEGTQDVRGNINFMLTAPWHAERSACVPDYGQGSPKYTLRDDGRLALDGNCPKPPHWDSLRNRIPRHSNLYRQVNQFIREQRQDGEIDLYLAIINQLNTLSHARGQRFIVGFIKAQDNWFSGKYSNLKIMDQLTKMGIEVIDLTLASSSEQLAREYYIHHLDRHPSAKANEARAMLLKKYLDKGPVL